MQRRTRLGALFAVLDETAVFLLHLTFDVPVKRLSWLMGLGGGQPCQPQPAKALPLPRVQAVWIDRGTADIDEPHLPGDHGSVTVGLQYEDGNPASSNSPDFRLHATLTPDPERRSFFDRDLSWEPRVPINR